MHGHLTSHGQSLQELQKIIEYLSMPNASDRSNNARQERSAIEALKHSSIAKLLESLNLMTADTADATLTAVARCLLTERNLRETATEQKRRRKLVIVLQGSLSIVLNSTSSTQEPVKAQQQLSSTSFRKLSVSSMSTFSESQPHKIILNEGECALLPTSESNPMFTIAGIDAESEEMPAFVLGTMCETKWNEVFGVEANVIETQKKIELFRSLPGVADKDASALATLLNASLLKVINRSRSVIYSEGDATHGIEYVMVQGEVTTIHRSSEEVEQGEEYQQEVSNGITGALSLKAGDAFGVTTTSTTTSGNFNSNSDSARRRDTAQLTSSFAVLLLVDSRRRLRLLQPQFIRKPRGTSGSMISQSGLFFVRSQFTPNDSGDERGGQGGAGSNTTVNGSLTLNESASMVLQRKSSSRASLSKLQLSQMQNNSSVINSFTRTTNKQLSGIVNTHSKIYSSSSLGTLNASKNNSDDSGDSLNGRKDEGSGAVSSSDSPGGALRVVKQQSATLVKQLLGCNSVKSNYTPKSKFSPMSSQEIPEIVPGGASATMATGAICSPVKSIKSSIFRTRKYQSERAIQMSSPMLDAEKNSDDLPEIQVERVSSIEKLSLEGGDDDDDDQQEQMNNNNRYKDAAANRSQYKKYKTSCDDHFDQQTSLVDLNNAAAAASTVEAKQSGQILFRDDEVDEDEQSDEKIKSNEVIRKSVSKIPTFTSPGPILSRRFGKHPLGSRETITASGSPAPSSIFTVPNVMRVSSEKIISYQSTRQPSPGGYGKKNISNLNSSINNNFSSNIGSPAFRIAAPVRSSSNTGLVHNTNSSTSNENTHLNTNIPAKIMFKKYQGIQQQNSPIASSFRSAGLVSYPNEDEHIENNDQEVDSMIEGAKSQEQSQQPPENTYIKNLKRQIGSFSTIPFVSLSPQPKKNMFINRKMMNKSMSSNRVIMPSYDLENQQQQQQQIQQHSLLFSNSYAKITAELQQPQLLIPSTQQISMREVNSSSNRRKSDQRLSEADDSCDGDQSFQMCQQFVDSSILGMSSSQTQVEGSGKSIDSVDEKTPKKKATPAKMKPFVPLLDLQGLAENGSQINNFFGNNNGNKNMSLVATQKQQSSGSSSASQSQMQSEVTSKPSFNLNLAMKGQTSQHSPIQSTAKISQSSLMQNGSMALNTAEGKRYTQQQQQQQQPQSVRPSTPVVKKLNLMNLNEKIQKTTEKIGNAKEQFNEGFSEIKQQRLILPSFNLPQPSQPQQMSTMHPSSEENTPTNEFANQLHSQASHNNILTLFSSKSKNTLVSGSPVQSMPIHSLYQGIGSIQLEKKKSQL